MSTASERETAGREEGFRLEYFGLPQRNSALVKCQAKLFRKVIFANRTVQSSSFSLLAETAT